MSQCESSTDSSDLEVLVVDHGTVVRRAANPPARRKPHGKAAIGGSSVGYRETNPLSAEPRQRSHKIHGFYKNSKVTVRLGKTGIVWLQEANQSSKSVAAGRKFTKQQQQPQPAGKVLRFPYENVISLKTAPSLEDDADDDEVRLSIAACRPSNSKGRWCLVERELRLSSSRRSDAERWLAQASSSSPSGRNKVRTVALFVNTRAGDGLPSSVPALLAKFGVHVAARRDAPNAESLAAAAAAAARDDPGLAASVDAVMIAGGDGTVRQVCAALLGSGGSSPSSARRPPPVCLLPTGRQNNVAASLLGGAGAIDCVTSVLHLLAGHRQLVNCNRVSSRPAGSSEEFQFLTWCFNAAYGLPTSAARLLPDHGRFDRALASALEDKSFAAYQCQLQVQVSPNAELSYPTDGNCCSPSCHVCQSAEARRSDSNSESTGQSGWQADFVDPVYEFDPLNSSHGSSTIIELTNRHAWMPVSGDFSWVGVYALSGLSGHYPGGLAPCAHRNDGCFDLVLLETAERREAAKFVRAMVTGSPPGAQRGSSHLDLPFVRSYRCTGLRFQADVKSRSRPERRDEIELDTKLQQQQQQQQLASHQLDPSNGAELVLDLLDGSPNGISLATTDSDSNNLARSSTTDSSSTGCFESKASPLPSPPPRSQDSRVSLADLLCNSSSSGGSDDGGSDSRDDAAADSGETAGRRTGANDKTTTFVAKSAKAQATLQTGDKSSHRLKLKELRRKIAASRLAKLLHTTPGCGRSSSDGRAVRTLAEIARERQQLELLERRRQLAEAEEARLRSRWLLDHCRLEQDCLELQFLCCPSVLEVFCIGAPSRDVRDSDC